MGLDAVELIMAVEEAFDIEIPDREAEKLGTVGQMYAFIVNKLAFDQSRRCLSSAVFYRARQALRAGLKRYSGRVPLGFHARNLSLGCRYTEPSID